MEELDKLTPTELLKKINDSKAEHERLKQEISDYTFEIEEFERKINERLETLTTVEKNYVELIEEYNNRQNAV